MRTNKKSKTLTFGPSDGNKWQVLLKHPNGEVINLKITYTPKAFGLQAFSERLRDPEGDDMMVFDEQGAITESNYVGVWKAVK